MNYNDFFRFSCYFILGQNCDRIHSICMRKTIEEDCVLSSLSLIASIYLKIAFQVRHELVIEHHFDYMVSRYISFFESDIYGKSIDERNSLEILETPLKLFDFLHDKSILILREIQLMNGECNKDLKSSFKLMLCKNEHCDTISSVILVCIGGPSEDVVGGIEVYDQYGSMFVVTESSLIDVPVSMSVDMQIFKFLEV